MSSTRELLGTRRPCARTRTVQYRTVGLYCTILKDISTVRVLYSYSSSLCARDRGRCGTVPVSVLVPGVAFVGISVGIVPIQSLMHSLTFLAIHPSKEGDSLRSYTFFLEGDKVCNSTVPVRVRRSVTGTVPYHVKWGGAVRCQGEHLNRKQENCIKI